MSLTVFFTRHGETEWNIEKRMQGRLNSPLTNKGKQDALKLGQRLAQTKFTKVFSSPSGRALETAQIITGGEAVVKDERLMEIMLGEWQGKTEGEIWAHDPLLFAQYWQHPHEYDNPYGESFQNVIDRMRDFLAELALTTSGNVLVVTHGVALRAIYSICRMLPVHQFWNGAPDIEGTSLTILTYESQQFQIVKEACTAHCQ
ncbi:histidine phosphatase family protein [Cytobacillus sp. Sa5YUA1]|uniref:Histidine phosphatase family protein n=1 Tax=Cytobacillus stercorigallinarum TaxID=2762240 RepID=A0ABR8QP99_9BACI|nr:histidine phosphatase family protein [Cytobacillus stercorigallinarum]MBD7937361.1 histidine phosphatase family protein [Cytobacillus stercorigallinarum]